VLRAPATSSVVRWSMQAAAGSTRRGPRASSSASSGGVGSSDPLPNINLGDTRTPEQIVEEGRELVQEVIRVAMQTPPQMSFERTVALSRALLLTARDVAGQFQGRSIQDVTQQELEKELPRTLRLLFERLGPTYVKLGQFVASSPTLFPAPYVEEFQKCFDDVEKVPFNKIKSIVQAELGSRRIEDVFSYIDEEPLATASIAQVHAAKLAKTGEDVVIKVQKPGVGDLLQVDLSFLLLATKTLEFLNPELRRLSLGDIASDIRTTMIDELDFTKEAQNIDDFERFLSTSGIKNVVCPFVFKDASSKRLLTMTRLYGKPLTDLDAIRLTLKKL
jgi:aarF domain-containing kinase